MRYNYEYLKSVYTGNHEIIPFIGDFKRSDKIDLRCHYHGVFKQAISTLLAGNGCRKCYYESKKGKLKYTTEEWISKSKIIHKDFYNYKKSVFTGVGNNITIICPVHGEFSQLAMSHLSGHGCRKCSTDKMVISRSYDTHKFIAVSNEKHNNKYTYEKTNFTGIRDKVIITCPDHGDFDQIAYYHTYGHGCPICGIENTTYKSGPEYEIIDFIESLGVKNIKQSDRHLGFELDVFLPEYKLAIEYNGLYWHSSNTPKKDKELVNYHLNKTKKCDAHGIKLFHIFENEWLDPIKQLIWKSVIKNALGKSNKIFARKCIIKEISTKTSADFCNANHLQGDVSSLKSYGLYHIDELVSVITIGQSRYKPGYIEILRYCNKIGYTIVGGFSKLLSYIETIVDKDIISYANRRWSNGNLYKKTGFTLVNISGPCYFYLDKNFNIFHRSTYTKKNVLKKFPNSVGTEVSIMYNNGYRRIWDCGNFVFKKGKNGK